MLGKDIKIAIFDDKIEVTIPGKLLPTVDFNEMDAGQSDVRNWPLNQNKIVVSMLYP